MVTSWAYKVVGIDMVDELMWWWTCPLLRVTRLDHWFSGLTGWLPHSPAKTCSLLEYEGYLMLKLVNVGEEKYVEHENNGED
jgi:hypothetical protein